MNRYIVPYVFSFLFLLCVAGCGKKPHSGPETHFVEGTVSLDGAPLGGVSIQFLPKEADVGELAMGKSEGNGRYKLSSVRGEPEKGAMEGTYVITASKEEAIELPKPKIDPATGDPILFTSKQLLSGIYQDTAKTPLSATVVKGKNKIDIELKSKL